MVAQLLYTETVGGSNPSSPTSFRSERSGDLPARGELNLKEYFDYLLSEGDLKPEWFLSSIEAGSEIVSGKGEIVFRRFVVH